MNAARTLAPSSSGRATLEHDANPRPTAAALRPVLHLEPTGRRHGAVDVMCTSQNGELFGWVRVRPVEDDSVVVENLNVLPRYRGADLGVLLLSSALAVGARWGRAKVKLEADDRGTGRLLRWYEQLGFERAGMGSRGMPVFEARIHDALPEMQRRLWTGRRR